MKRLLFLLCILLSSLPASTVCAENLLVILKSGDQAQYNASVEGFSQAADQELSKSFTTRIITTDTSITYDQLLVQVGSENIAAVWAIGKNAADIQATLPDSIPLLISHVLNWEPFAGSRKQTSIITMQVEPATVLGYFRLLAPERNRMTVLCNSDSCNAKTLSSLEQAARQLDITLSSRSLSAKSNIARVWRRLKKETDILWLPLDPLLMSPSRFLYLAKACRESGVALIVGSARYVNAGALLALSPDYFSVGSQASLILSASLLHNCLKAINRPIGTVWTVNGDTARMVGLGLDDLPVNFIDKTVVGP